MEIEKEKEKNQPHDSTKTTSSDHPSPAADDRREPESPKNNNAGAESDSPAKKEPETPKFAGESRTESSESPEERGGEEEAPATNEEPPPPDFNELCQEMDKFIASLAAEAKTEEAETGEAKTEEAETGDVKTEEAETGEAKTEEEPETPEIPDIADQFAFLAEANIANHDLMKWTQLPEDESSSFLEIVDRIARLSSALSAFSSVAKYGPLINRTGGILQRAMSYLEDEFRSLLEEPPAADSEQKDSDSKQKDSSNAETEETPEEPKSAGDKKKNTHGYSDEVVKSLNTLAKTMIKGGYETECFQVYIVARRTALEEALHKCAFEKLSIDEIQRMQWEQLEREIDTWTNTFKQFVTVNFVSEKDLLLEVFRCEGFTIPDDVFTTLSRGIMIQLLNFAEAVAVAKRSSEKLFKFIDIYETLRDVVPKIEELWNEENCNELKTEASLTRCRLGEGIVSIFTELENSIKADTGKTQVPGGAVHPLTRYTMNYLKYACEYKETLEQVFREHQKIERADSVPGSDFDHTAAQGGGSGSAGGGGQLPPSSNKQGTKPSPFATQIYKVMDLLDTNLESKSKLYKDHALSSIFMMNNGRYILQKIKGSAEIHDLMGDTWSRKRSSELRNYHKTYQRETWGRLLGCLSQEGLNVNGKVSKPVLKEKFKAFNAMFDEIHKTQSVWVVSDEQLQSELRVSISAVVIPAYRSFLARYSQIFTPGRQTEKYIKYQPEDIETSIDELFDGNATPTGRKKQ